MWNIVTQILLGCCTSNSNHFVKHYWQKKGEAANPICNPLLMLLLGSSSSLVLLLLSNFFSAGKRNCIFFFQIEMLKRKKKDRGNSKYTSQGGRSSYFSFQRDIPKKDVKRNRNEDFISKSSFTVFGKYSQKVSFDIASEASYVYILSGQKLMKNTKNGAFGDFLKNLKLVVKQCYQTAQF